MVMALSSRVMVTGTIPDIDLIGVGVPILHVIPIGY